MAADVVARLEHGDVVFRMQMMRGGEAADAAADDGDLHGWRSEAGPNAAAPGASGRCRNPRPQPGAPPLRIALSGFAVCAP